MTLDRQAHHATCHGVENRADRGTFAVAGDVAARYRPDLSTRTDPTMPMRTIYSRRVQPEE